MGVDRHLCGAQQTGGFDPMLFQYWPTANGAGPTLKQHWVKSSCFLRELSAFGYTVASVSGWNRLHSALCTLFQESIHLIDNPPKETKRLLEPAHPLSLNDPKLH